VSSELVSIRYGFIFYHGLLVYYLVCISSLWALVTHKHAFQPPRLPYLNPHELKQGIISLFPPSSLPELKAFLAHLIEHEWSRDGPRSLRVHILELSTTSVSYSRDTVPLPQPRVYTRPSLLWSTPRTNPSSTPGLIIHLSRLLNINNKCSSYQSFSATSRFQDL
jgi:hypothetical protein